MKLYMGKTNGSRVFGIFDSLDNLKEGALRFFNTENFPAQLYVGDFRSYPIEELGYEYYSAYILFDSEDTKSVVFDRVSVEVFELNKHTREDDYLDSLGAS